MTAAKEKFKKIRDSLDETLEEKRKKAVKSSPIKPLEQPEETSMEILFQEGQKGGYRERQRERQRKSVAKRKNNH